MDLTEPEIEHNVVVWTLRGPPVGWSCDALCRGGLSRNDLSRDVYWGLYFQCLLLPQWKLSDIRLQRLQPSFPISPYSTKSQCPYPKFRTKTVNDCALSQFPKSQNHGGKEVDILPFFVIRTQMKRSENTSKVLHCSTKGTTRMVVVQKRGMDTEWIR